MYQVWTAAAAGGFGRKRKGQDEDEAEGDGQGSSACLTGIGMLRALVYGWVCARLRVMTALLPDRRSLLVLMDSGCCSGPKALCAVRVRPVLEANNKAWKSGFQ
jgi:hypothetical protein